MAEGGYIDFHVHLPWREHDPREAARRLLAEMDSAGVERAVVIAVEPSLKLFKERVNAETIRKAAADALDYLVYMRIPRLRRILFSPEESLNEHERILVEHTRRSEDVLEAAEASGGRLLAVASYNPELGPIGTLERIKGKRYLGVKLYPTLHFCTPNEKRLRPLLDYMESEGLILIVHTGCDPGIWELPDLCSGARPSSLEPVARRHRDLVIVVAHLGSYSALKPGIYFDEALRLIERYDNVYADTSAVDSFLVELAVERVGYDKLLFGSDYPYVTGLTIADFVESILRMNIEWRAKMAILRWNAERLLKRLGRL
ncbi:MAG: amidohydrolase family protein [Desulfurococcales archaeon]|nr:amidohydrolase family protein [Desulfurococcales archaeon]